MTEGFYVVRFPNQTVNDWTIAELTDIRLHWKKDVPCEDDERWAWMQVAWDALIPFGDAEILAGPFTPREVADWFNSRDG